MTLFVTPTNVKGSQPGPTYTLDPAPTDPPAGTRPKQQLHFSVPWNFDGLLRYFSMCRSSHLGRVSLVCMVRRPK